MGPHFKAMFSLTDRLLMFLVRSSKAFNRLVLKISSYLLASAITLFYAFRSKSLRSAASRLLKTEGKPGRFCTIFNAKFLFSSRCDPKLYRLGN